MAIMDPPLMSRLEQGSDWLTDKQQQQQQPTSAQYTRSVISSVVP